MRRRDIKGGIVALHALRRRAHAHACRGEVRVAHLDVHRVHGRMPLIGRAGDKVRDAHVLGDDGILERTDLVDHMAVAADSVSGGGEHIHALALHDKRPAYCRR